jgi:hypothetical protein
MAASSSTLTGQDSTLSVSLYLHGGAKPAEFRQLSGEKGGWAFTGLACLLTASLDPPLCCLSYFLSQVRPVPFLFFLCSCCFC